ncbi:ATP-binding protein [Aeromonas aquatilis]
MQTFAFVDLLCLCESGCLPTRWGDLQEQKRNLQPIGGTGAGKTHLAIPLGRNAVRRGK